MTEEQSPLLEDSAADPPITAPQPGALDVDLVISKLLGYKNNPGKQVRFLLCFAPAPVSHYKNEYVSYSQIPTVDQGVVLGPLAVYNLQNYLSLLVGVVIFIFLGAHSREPDQTTMCKVTRAFPLPAHVAGA